MRRVDPTNPEWELIVASVPQLVDTFAARLDAMGQARRSTKELLDIAEDGLHGRAPYELWQAGPCLVGLNIVKQWWSNDSMLFEEFIVRYKEGNFADTIKELEAYAEAQGCTSLVISSLAQLRKESYGHYLKRKGFREVARQYMKGIPNGWTHRS